MQRVGPRGEVLTRLSDVGGRRVSPVAPCGLFDPNRRDLLAQLARPPHQRAPCSEQHRGIVVTSGSIDISTDGSGATTVSAGQSLVFAAHHRHEYRNTTDRAGEFHLAVFDPIDDPAAH
jgi:mannose-6-phosphate isomerase-like protein (cupin superfamily)